MDEQRIREIVREEIRSLVASEVTIQLKLDASELEKWRADVQLRNASHRATCAEAGDAATCECQTATSSCGAAR